MLVYSGLYILLKEFTTGFYNVIHFELQVTASGEFQHRALHGAWMKGVWDGSWQIWRRDPQFPGAQLKIDSKDLFFRGGPGK